TQPWPNIAREIHGPFDIGVIIHRTDENNSAFPRRSETCAGSFLYLPVSVIIRIDAIFDYKNSSVSAQCTQPFGVSLADRNVRIKLKHGAALELAHQPCSFSCVSLAQQIRLAFGISAHQLRFNIVPVTDYARRFARGSNDRK